MDQEKKGTSIFLKFVQKNDLESLRSYVEGLNSYNVNGVCLKNGETSLHVASRQGYLELLRFLVEELDGNIEVADFDGKTPLHDGAQFSHVDVVRYLISKGGKVDAVKKSDWTPLMLACTKKQEEVVEILLSAGANPRFQNKDGWNSLHIAAREGDVNVVQKILQWSGQGNELDSSCNLCCAKSKNGRTPLHTAVMHGHELVTKALLQHKCGKSLCYENVDVKDSCNNTPLMDACRFGFLNLMKTLIQPYKADLSLRNSLGMNCLHISAEAGQLAIIESLVKDYGMFLNSATTNGLTPLHFATRENHTKAVELLIKLGASVQVEDNNGHTCVQLAKLLKKTDVLKLFKQNIETLSSAPVITK